LLRHERQATKGVAEATRRWRPRRLRLRLRRWCRRRRGCARSRWCRRWGWSRWRRCRCGRRRRSRSGWRRRRSHSSRRPAFEWLEVAASRHIPRLAQRVPLGAERLSLLLLAGGDGEVGGTIELFDLRLRRRPRSRPRLRGPIRRRRPRARSDAHRRQRHRTDLGSECRPGCRHRQQR
jgi:hypothetical protein